MTVDLKIGRMTRVLADEWNDGRTLPWTEWLGPLPEEDGANPDRIHAGHPTRIIAWGWVSDMFTAFPVLDDLLAGWNGTNDWQLFPITAELAQKTAIAPMPPEGTWYNDVAKWLKYWVRRAREEYGDEAGILLT